MSALFGIQHRHAKIPTIAQITRCKMTGFKWVFRTKNTTARNFEELQFIIRIPHFFPLEKVTSPKSVTFRPSAYTALLQALTPLDMCSNQNSGSIVCVVKAEGQGTSVSTKSTYPFEAEPKVLVSPEKVIVRPAITCSKSTSTFPYK